MALVLLLLDVAAWAVPSENSLSPVSQLLDAFSGLG